MDCANQQSLLLSRKMLFHFCYYFLLLLSSDAFSMLMQLNLIQKISRHYKIIMLMFSLLLLFQCCDFMLSRLMTRCYLLRAKYEKGENFSPTQQQSCILAAECPLLDFFRTLGEIIFHLRIILRVACPFLKTARSGNSYVTTRDHELRSNHTKIQKSWHVFFQQVQCFREALISVTSTINLES